MSHLQPVRPNSKSFSMKLPLDQFVAKSVQRTSAVSAVRESNPGRQQIFCTRPDQPWGPPSLLCNGYRVSFLGAKRPGRGVNNQLPSSTEVKERVQIYSHCECGTKMYSSLPRNICSLRNDRELFKKELYKYLLANTFYSVKVFLEFQCG